MQFSGSKLVQGDKRILNKLIETSIPIFSKVRIEIIA
jgi:hypothetical protein